MISIGRVLAGLVAFIWLISRWKHLGIRVYWFVAECEPALYERLMCGSFAAFDNHYQRSLITHA